MLLMFPSGFPVQEDVVNIRSINKDDFDRQVEDKIRSGYEVQTLSSNFRKALFGGTSFYKAELKRVKHTEKQTSCP